jgi:hypothetical protein
VIAPRGASDIFAMSSKRTLSFTDEPRGSIYQHVLEASLADASIVYVVLRESVDVSAMARRCLTKLEPFLMSNQMVREWPGTALFSGEAHRLSYHWNDSCRRVLASCAEGLYEWLQPERPEDLGLLRSDGSVWLASVAHERDAWLELEFAECDRLLRVCPEIADITH